MRKTWILIAPLFVQCSDRKEIQTITEIVYQTDTVYIETTEPQEKYPWHLECADTADTQTDMNICSRDCYIVADSLTEVGYRQILAIFDQKIPDADPGNEHYYQTQKSRIKTIHEHFAIIRTTTADYSYSFYEGGTMAPLVYSSTKTWITEFEFKLLQNLKFEAEQR